MAIYTVNSGKVVTASNAAKVGVQLATGAGVTAKLIAVDISFDGVDASKTGILCEIQRGTAASSGGTTYTPVNVGGGAARTAQTTARINDTTNVGGPTSLQSWLISPTAAFAYQWSLGREIEMSASSFLAVTLTTVTASGTPNYVVSATFEE